MASCGPETIFLKPPLDTPQRHVENGNKFLSHGKISDAKREFEQAKTLDPQYVPAIIGDALAHGYAGEKEASLRLMQKAQGMAETQKDKTAVKKGYEQLKEILSDN